MMKDGIGATAIEFRGGGSCRGATEGGLGLECRAMILHAALGWPVGARRGGTEEEDM